MYEINFKVQFERFSTSLSIRFSQMHGRCVRTNILYSIQSQFDTLLLVAVGIDT